ncbi:MULTISPECIES: hypothetical protein [unclassified Duganella]|uniref:DUF7940 domain-containing protein n=1 Tax=unclassified Duganella TaxID=2636909 RepID=UPI00088E5611|nr:MULTISPECIES: hypothetical protein [unclassified Duganella]SDG85066.1 hypothetical protein SAMN05216320_107288 [Duganella sp. OV458]SDK12471.1 hypothetical protein SAMN05428973_108289 [Duganella sp. OV510]
MKIQLIDDWRAVLRKAWSLKFSLLAAVLSAAELAVQFMQPESVPRGVFAAIAGGVSLLAGLARLVAQTELSGGNNGNNT